MKRFLLQLLLGATSIAIIIVADLGYAALVHRFGIIVILLPFNLSFGWVLSWGILPIIEDAIAKRKERNEEIAHKLRCRITGENP